MKILTTTLIAATVCTFAFAQKADKALARVRYTFSHMRDTTQRDNFYTENMLLVTGNNASVYTSYDKINRDLEIKKSIEDQIKSQGGTLTSLNINRTSTKSVTAIDYFYFANENKFYTKERVISNYLVEETAPKINWKINKDTASFSGVKCQKAIANFKGRTWTAWFAPELPFQSGPWKLNGLPGLIIEAIDETKTVHFQFAGIENVIPEETIAPEKDGPKIITPGGGTLPMASIMGMDGNSYLASEIKLPADAIKTSRKELDKLKAARDKDPQGFMNAQMAAQGVSLGSGNTTVRRSSSFTPSTAPKNVTNNPIELPETK